MTPGEVLVAGLTFIAYVGVWAVLLLAAIGLLILLFAILLGIGRGVHQVLKKTD